MKKLLSMVLALMLCLTAVSALAETTLKLGIYPEETEQVQIDSHEAWIAAFEEKYPDVTVERAHYKYATDTFVPMADAGTVPTIFESWFTEPGKLIAGGFVADITDELNERGWVEKMNPNILSLLSDDEGHVYSIPRDAYALGLMINAEVFEDAGLVDEDGIPTYPKTWDEVLEYGKIIKEETGSAALCLLAKDAAGGWHFSNIAWCFGAEFEAQDENGKWIAQVNSPEAIEAMEFVQTMYKEGILTSDPTSEDWGTGFTQLGTGAAAMYIGANDAVAQPTAYNGLDVDKLMMAPIPAGPRGDQHSLMGGTPYFFANNATEDEINAALNYLEIMGKSPVLTETAIEGLKLDAQYRQENGIPVIDEFPAWSDEELIQARRDVVAEYKNVDDRMFSAYFEATRQEGNLKLEEPQLAQELYAELTKVLQEVVTNPDADVAALMETANTNFQAILDEKVNG